MSAVVVDVDNFARAETNRRLEALLLAGPGLNRWHHDRTPVALDDQPLPHMNRDVLGSVCVADISAGAILRVPESDGRYVSVMIVNQDHYINKVFRDPGEYELTVDEFDTPYVLVAARAFVDSSSPADVAIVNEWQDGLELFAGSAQPFEPPEYATASFNATRLALFELARNLGSFAHAFGSRDAVNPVHHLIGCAADWGGVPAREAVSVDVDPGLPVGQYSLTLNNVPVDGFWSISVYNAEGFFESNDGDSDRVHSVNSLTATRNPDGSITVNFGECAFDRPNCLPISSGWNYAVRLYRPHPEILDGTWTFPSIATD